MTEAKKEYKTAKNVYILSVAFLLLMAAYLTTAAISQIVLQSAKEEDPSLEVDGFISLAVLNIAFSITNFFAPVIVTSVGVRNSLIFGTALYATFTASFIHPKPWLLYGASAIIGFAAANVWVACGCFFAHVCTKENIGKFLGINWTIMACGQTLGCAFVFWKFQGSNHIDYDTRLLVITVLTCICISSSITLIFIDEPTKKGQSDNEKSVEIKEDGIASLLIKPFRLLGNKHMLLLIPPSLSNGLEIAHFGSIFPTTVGFTEAYGNDARKLVGLAGILIGVGSIAGGLIFGIIGDKFVKSRSVKMTAACVSFCLSSFLTYINHPNEASSGPTQNVSWMDPPFIPFSLMSAFLLGFGDGCLSPQMTASIGVTWPANPSPALAVYRFFQASTCAFGFFLGTVTGLYNQLIIFSVVSIVGTLTYYWNEILIHKETVLLSDTVKQINIIPKKLSIGFPQPEKS